MTRAALLRVMTAACAILSVGVVYGQYGEPTGRQIIPRSSDQFGPTVAGGLHFEQSAASPNSNTDRPRPITKPARRITPAAQAPESRAGGGSFVTTLMALSLVVGIILVAARSWKRLGPRMPGGVPAEAMEVLGRRHIDPRQAIVLVRLGSRILVLGSSPGGLQTLSEIDDPLEVDMLAGLCRQASESGGALPSFRTLFQSRTTRSSESNRRRKPPRTRSQNTRRERNDASEFEPASPASPEETHVASHPA